MAILQKNIGTFFVEKGHQFVVVTFEFSPERKFGLQIDTFDVGSHEGCLWWTPRMEADMVDAVALTNLQVAAPSDQVHRHVASIGEYAGIVLAT